MSKKKKLVTIRYYSYTHDLLDERKLRWKHVKPYLWANIHPKTNYVLIYDNPWLVGIKNGDLIYRGEYVPDKFNYKSKGAWKTQEKIKTEQLKARMRQEERKEQHDE
jgi:TfoX/Sxy family transcriptional regulator of competence genes